MTVESVAKHVSQHWTRADEQNLHSRISDLHTQCIEDPLMDENEINYESEVCVNYFRFIGFINS